MESPGLGASLRTGPPKRHGGLCDLCDLDTEWHLPLTLGQKLVSPSYFIQSFPFKLTTFSPVTSIPFAHSPHSGLIFSHVL